MKSRNKMLKEKGRKTVNKIHYRLFSTAGVGPVGSTTKNDFFLVSYSDPQNKLRHPQPRWAVTSV